VKLAFFFLCTNEGSLPVLFAEIPFQEPPQSPIEPPRGLEENASLKLYTGNHPLSIGFGEKRRKILPKQRPKAGSLRNLLL
jgi:hypothetical protein